ncbi:MAG: hypothetical protein ACXW15_09380 [Acidimicrobiia bacterium]
MSGEAVVPSPEVGVCAGRSVLAVVVIVLATGTPAPTEIHDSWMNYAGYQAASEIHDSWMTMADVAPAVEIHDSWMITP